MTLYTHLGSKPAPLPFRIILSNGASRTDPATFTAEEIADAGYIEAPAAPAYDPATQHPPVWQAGAWVVSDKTEAELAAELDAAKASAVEQVKQIGATLMAEGFAHDFGGSLGVQHLQLRNADDKANWLTAKDRMRDAIAAGLGDAAIVPMRTAENEVATVTPNEGVVILAALSTWGEQMFATSWAKQDAIRAATDRAAFDALVADLETGWPV